MSEPKFVNLHTHSTYSTLDGFSTITEYIAHAKKHGQPALGITDHGNLHGVWELITQAQANGITPVPGCEFYVAPMNPDGAKAQTPIYYGDGGEADVSGRGGYLHLTMWATNDTGLKNLFTLGMLAAQPEHKRAGHPRIDLTMMQNHHEGIIVSTGCPSGEISTRFRLNQDDKAYEYAQTLIDIYGAENVYVEIMNHNMHTDLERNLLVKQLKLAKDLKLPLLATNDCHYAHPENAPHHEEMLAIGTGTTMTEPPRHHGGKRFCFDGDQYYLKTAQEMLQLFPEETYPNAVTNTVKLANRIEKFTLFNYRPDLRPTPPIPTGHTEETYLRHLTETAAHTQYANNPQRLHQALDRINKELDVLASADYTGYMLIVHEYVNWFRNQYSIRNTQGDIIMSAVGVARGSAGGSLTAYLLGITDIDPLEHGLYFERFISAGRVDQAKLTSGTNSITLPVSEKLTVLTPTGQKTKKYVHQIQPGDWVLADHNTHPLTNPN